MEDGLSKCCVMWSHDSLVQDIWNIWRKIPLYPGCKMRKSEAGLRLLDLKSTYCLFDKGFGDS
jgi:hypothetical protein